LKGINSREGGGGVGGNVGEILSSPQEKMQLNISFAIVFIKVGEGGEGKGAAK